MENKGRNLRWEREKTRSFGPHPTLSGPHPSGPTFSGFGPPPFRLPLCISLCVREWRDSVMCCLTAICDRLCALCVSLVQKLCSPCWEAQRVKHWQRKLPQKKHAQRSWQPKVWLPDGSEEIVPEDEAFRRWGAKGKGVGVKGRAAGHKGGDQGHTGGHLRAKGGIWRKRCRIWRSRWRVGCEILVGKAKVSVEQEAKQAVTHVADTAGQFAVVFFKVHNRTFTPKLTQSWPWLSVLDQFSCRLEFIPSERNLRHFEVTCVFGMIQHLHHIHVQIMDCHETLSKRNFLGNQMFRWLEFFQCPLEALLNLSMQLRNKFHSFIHKTSGGRGQSNSSSTSDTPFPELDDQYLKHAQSILHNNPRSLRRHWEGWRKWLCETYTLRSTTHRCNESTTFLLYFKGPRSNAIVARNKGCSHFPIFSIFCWLLPQTFVLVGVRAIPFFLVRRMTNVLSEICVNKLICWFSTRVSLDEKLMTCGPICC